MTVIVFHISLYHFLVLQKEFEGAGIVVKPPPAAPTSCMSADLGFGCPVILCFLNVPGKVMEDGLNLWAPAPL